MVESPKLRLIQIAAPFTNMPERASERFLQEPSDRPTRPGAKRGGKETAKAHAPQRHLGLHLSSKGRNEKKKRGTFFASLFFFFVQQKTGQKREDVYKEKEGGVVVVLDHRECATEWRGRHRISDGRLLAGERVSSVAQRQ